MWCQRFWNEKRSNFRASPLVNYTLFHQMCTLTLSKMFLTFLNAFLFECLKIALIRISVGMTHFFTYLNELIECDVVFFNFIRLLSEWHHYLCSFFWYATHQKESFYLFFEFLSLMTFVTTLKSVNELEKTLI